MNLARVAELLTAAGVEATHEYPGFVSVEIGIVGGTYWAFGTENGTLGGNRVHISGRVTEACDLGAHDTDESAAAAIETFLRARGRAR